jgi:hypothetical protein
MLTPRLRLMVSPISPFPHSPFCPYSPNSLTTIISCGTRLELSHLWEDIFAKPLKRLHDLVMCHATKVDLGQDVG